MARDGTSNSENGNRELVRLSVVLDAALAEHVRIRAFETRKSRSAYVRALVAEDAERNASTGEAFG